MNEVNRHERSITFTKQIHKHTCIYKNLKFQLRPAPTNAQGTSKSPGSDKRPPKCYFYFIILTNFPTNMTLDRVAILPRPVN